VTLAQPSAASDAPDLHLVERELLIGRPPEVARGLLNLVLVHGARRARIVEVEAYGGADDAASHAHHRRSERNASMFGPPGTCYVYFTYGMHHCVNVVCQPEGIPGAVLLRAARPLEGLQEMGRARGLTDPRALCSGPAKLCQALSITRDLDGIDLLDPSSPLRLCSDGASSLQKVLVGPRIGISERAGAARQLQWRFAVAEEQFLSRGGFDGLLDSP
jgi:DNA-3-methyladenine glycosylase